jgi:hypothetical protein
VAWPKGVALSERHKGKIRASVLRTIPLRRKRRTDAQRERDAGLDPRSLGKRIITPRPEWWKKPKQVRDGVAVYGQQPKEEVRTILGGRIRLIGHLPGRGAARPAPTLGVQDRRPALVRPSPPPRRPIASGHGHWDDDGD